MQKVIPPGLNYGDIKPEAIENQIRIVKFTPIATITSAQANDIVRFHLQGNGFYDPYSAYIRIRIQIDEPAAIAATDYFSGKFLDRSAHSLFSRLVIRSQGTELERIEQYDVMSAMINDMIYSQEQRILHHYEGFASKQAIAANLPTLNSADNDFTAGSKTSCAQMLPFITPGAAEVLQNRFGDYGAWKIKLDADVDDVEALQQVFVSGCRLKVNPRDAAKSGGDVAGTTLEAGKMGKEFSEAQGYVGLTFKNIEEYRKAQQVGQVANSFSNSFPIGVENYGTPVTMGDLFTYNKKVNEKSSGIITHIEGKATNRFGLTGQEQLTAAKVLQNSREYEFCIPIYSGILGVLMPTKKLLPMSLLPLEIEFTMNPHAFYPVGSETKRGYRVSRFEIWTHTMFFEQELHRSLEAAVAESGVFLHYNSFYLAPVNTYNGKIGALPQYNQIGVFLKSINSLHWTFLYNTYEQEDGPRKLHFVCHNVNSLQVRNGMDLMPSEPILGQTGGNTVSSASVANFHAPYLIETFKGWNKMHDPISDAALNSFNYNVDHVLTKPKTLDEWAKQSMTVGTCQYAISLEGDELGTNKTMIGGKKSVMPFDINLSAYKSCEPTSYMMCFLRADFIIYVRPDLVVTRLGL